MRRRISSSVGILLLSLSNYVCSEITDIKMQTTEINTGKAIEEVYVTGSRTGKSLSSAPVPVDVLSADTLSTVSSTELLDDLATLVPSFNVRRFPVNDEATFVRPPTMRGLPADHTLVMVNGKRRHRAALVPFDLIQGQGQGVDLAQIPSLAAKRIEVLRDGASAQYGSDAIAGVINIILDDTPGTRTSVQWGETNEGDGDALQAAAIVGVPVLEDGFFNLTMEYVDAEATSRTGIHTAAQKLYDEGNHNVPLPPQVWGQPNRESTRLVYNFAVPMEEGLEFYTFGNYSESSSDGSFNYRVPNGSQFNRSAYQDGLDPITGEAITPLFPDYSLTDIYPGGYTPRFGADITDFSLATGVNGMALGEKLTWDISAYFGENEIEYLLKNSSNPSMGPNTSRNFKPGTQIQREFNLNIDSVYTLDHGWSSRPVSLAFGAEYRVEEHELKRGDEASYITGPLADLKSGSDGYPGFGPDSEGSEDRDNIALYADMELEPSEALLINLAARYEDFSDFGSTVNGKAALRFQANDWLALRGSVNTSFRAPTPGQQFIRRTQVTNIADPNNPLQIIPSTRGVFPSTDPVAAYFGGKPLNPEEAVNTSFGVVLEPAENFTMALDIYSITINDRISISRNFELSADDKIALKGLGVSNADSIDAIQFLSNGFTEKVNGFDLVVNYTIGWEGADTTNFNLSFNHNEIEISDVKEDLISSRIEFDIAEELPENTAIFTATHTCDSFSILARVRYFGEWSDINGEKGSLSNQVFGEEAFLDLSLTYKVTEKLNFTLSLDNVLDEYPDRARFNSERGVLYSRNSPYGFDGGVYSLRMSVEF